jgi:hypothetical protein
MARRAEATLWMLIKQGDKSRYISVSKVGSGRYAPNIDGRLVHRCVESSEGYRRAAISEPGSGRKIASV